VAAAIESKVTLPGVPRMVCVARAHVAHVLEGTPRVDDAVLVASELVTDGIRTGHRDVSIAVTVAGCRARIEVGHIRPIPARRMQVPDDELSPGLGLIAGLLDGIGHDRDPDGGTWWAELSWSDGEDT
jgi:hypothetical protein